MEMRSKASVSSCLSTTRVEGEAVFILVYEIAVIRENIGLQRQAEGFFLVLGAQEEALVREADFDFVVGQPFADFEQIFLGDEKAFLAQGGADVGVGELQEAELMAVEAADLDVIALHGRGRYSSCWSGLRRRRCRRRCGR